MRTMSTKSTGKCFQSWDNDMDKDEMLWRITLRCWFLQDYHSHSEVKDDLHALRLTCMVWSGSCLAWLFFSHKINTHHLHIIWSWLKGCIDKVLSCTHTEYSINACNSQLSFLVATADLRRSSWCSQITRKVFFTQSLFRFLEVAFHGPTQAEF